MSGGSRRDLASGPSTWVFACIINLILISRLNLVVGPTTRFQCVGSAPSRDCWPFGRDRNWKSSSRSIIKIIIMVFIIQAYLSSPGPSCSLPWAAIWASG